MSHHEDEQLDGLLRQWQTARSASPQRLDELTRAITARVAAAHEVADDGRTSDQPSLTAGSTIGQSPTTRKWLPVSAAVAVAALLLVAVLVLPERTAQHQRAAAVDTAVEVARFSPGQLARNALLADEARAVFPQHFRWLMHSGDDLRIELATEESFDAAASADTNTSTGGQSGVLALRFVLMSRSSDQDAWEPRRTFVYVTRIEELVESSPESTAAADVLFWSHAVDDGMLMIESRVSIPGDVPIDVSTSRIQRSGIPAEIYRQHVDGVEYRLYQTPVRLDDSWG